MKRLTLLPLFCGICLAISQMQAREISITPGTLQYRIDEIRGNSDALLVIKGKADVRDLSLLKKLPETTRTLDLSNLHIEAYSYPEGGYMGRREFKANELPGALFMSTSVENIILPASLTSIGDAAFAGSRLKEITIPAAVTSTGDYLFSGVTSLSKATVPSTAFQGKGMFRNCISLATVNIDGALGSIPESTFEGCASLTQNPAPGAAAYGPRCFTKSGLQSVDLSEAAEVGDFAFAEMPALTSVTVAADASTIYGTGAFYGNPVIADLPQWKANIPPLFGASSAARLSKTIDTEIIEEGAFANNTVASVIMLGPAVREIRRDAFRNDSRITTVYVSQLGSTLPALDHNAFAGLENESNKYDIILYVDDDYIDIWREDPEWSRFNIRKVSQSGIVNPVDSDVTVNRTDNRIHLSATTPIDYLIISTLNGIIVYSGAPDAAEFTMTVPPGILIIKLRAGNRLKVMKLQ